jgi:GTP-binding nuclear protein Ran
MATSSSTKVCFVGNAKSGKTSVARELLGLEPNDVYKPTLGVDVHAYRKSNDKVYNIWDCAGNSKYGGLRDGYWLECNLFLLFQSPLDNTHPNTPLSQWVTDIRRVSPTATIHLVDSNNINQIMNILV